MNNSSSICRRPRLSGVAWLLWVQLLALSFAAHAQSITGTTASGLIYTSLSGQVSITNYAGSGGAVSIPGTINNLPVTSIGEQAFMSCLSLTSVTIPNGVTSIGEAAFYDCAALTGVTIPNSVTSIGISAFDSCAALTGVTIPYGVTSIGESAFDSCTALISVTIPDSVTSIGVSAFAYCTDLTGVTIGKNVANIGVLAFFDCTTLASVVFMGNAPAMENDVFDSTASGFEVFYFSGATGFTSPTWNGWASVPIGAPTVASGTASWTTGKLFSYQVKVTGTATSYGATGMPPGLVCNAVTGLISGVPVERGIFKVVLSASNPAGSGTGILNLTLTSPPAVSAESTSETVFDATMVNGAVNPNGLPTTCYFQYGRSIAYGATAGTQSAGSGTSTVPVSAVITGLTGATTYHYQLVAANSSGTTYGLDKTFTTPIPQLVFTNSATKVSANAATLNSLVDEPETKTTFFQYGLTSAYGLSTASESVNGSGMLPASAILTGLAPATLYHYRAVANIGSETDYFGSDMSFVTLPSFPLTPVAASSGTAEGIPNARFLSFGIPAINDSHTVAFHAVVAGLGINATNDSGIWVQTGTSMALLVHTGSATTFLSGSKTATGIFTTLSDPVLNDQNQIAFLGNMISGNVISEGLWISKTNGNPSLVAQTGTTFAAFPQFVLTDKGRVAFLAIHRLGAGVTMANDQGLWVATPAGNTRLIARTGFPLTSTTGTTANITTLSIFPFPVGVGGQTRSFNSEGEFMFGATFVGKSQGIFVTNTNGIVSVVSLAKDDAPIGSGSATFTTFATPIINDAGKAAFRAILSGTGMTIANDTGIWAESGASGTLGLVARTGVAVSYTGTGSAPVTGTFLALGDPVSNASDQIAFIGTVKSGTGRNMAIGQGIWTTGTSLSELLLVAQAQEPAPGCSTGVKFSAFSELVLPDQGGAVFVAELAGAGVTVANNQGLWALNTSGQPTLVVRKGNVIAVDANGMVKNKTVATLSIFSSSTAARGQTRSFNTAGDLVYRVTFTDGTQGIYQVAFP